MALAAIAVWLIVRELHKYGLSAIAREFMRLPHGRVAASAFATFGCYLLLSAYDLLAFRYIQRTIALTRVILGSFLGFAFSNNFSGANFTGAAIRYRIYSASGITAGEVTRMAAFYVSASWLGFLLAAGVAFLVNPIQVPHWLHLPGAGLFAIGIFFLAAVTGAIVWRLTHDQPLRILRWTLPLPSRRLVTGQIVVAGIDWLITGIVPYLLLGAYGKVPYPQFLSIYLLAHLAGMISHVPGGLGVFEAVMLFFLAAPMGAPAVAAGLIAYRVLYFFVPFGVAAASLGAFELRRRGARAPSSH